MFSTYFILCMNKYDYHICLLFFMISGPNLSSTFIILYMAGFLTQWSFHKVQEHPKRSSDEEVMTFRSWMLHVVKPSRANLNYLSSPIVLHRHMNGFLTQWAFHRVQEHPERSSDEEVMTFRSWRSHVVKPSRADLNYLSSPIVLHRHMNGFLTQWDFHRVLEHPKRSSYEEVMTFKSWRSHIVKPNQAGLNWPS